MPRMGSTEPVDSRGESWLVAAKVVVTLVVGFAALGWLLFSWLLWSFRCDDTCGVGVAESWRWTGPLVLAACGSALAILGMALGFTSRRAAQPGLLMGGCACALAWVLWVLGSGIF